MIIDILAAQCADVCVAMAVGICVGMITGALVMYQLMREAAADKKKRERKAPPRRREPFDGRAWVRHYATIADIPEGGGNGNE